MIDLQDLFIGVDPHMLILIAGATEVFRRVFIYFGLSALLRSWIIPIVSMIISVIVFLVVLPIEALTVIKALSFSLLISTTVAFTRPILFKNSMSKYLIEKDEIETKEKSITQLEKKEIVIKRDNIDIDLMKSSKEAMLQFKNNEQIAKGIKKSVDKLAMLMVEVSKEMAYIKEHSDDEVYSQLRKVMGITPNLEKAFLEIDKQTDILSITSDNAEEFWLERFLGLKDTDIEVDIKYKIKEINAQFLFKINRVLEGRGNNEVLVTVSKWAHEFEVLSNSASKEKLAEMRLQFNQLQNKYKGQIDKLVYGDKDILSMINNWFEDLQNVFMQAEVY